MFRDLHHNIATKRVISAVAVATAAAKAGVVIDRAGYRGVEFIISYGSVTATNATLTPVIKEGDVTGTLTSVADADLLGTEANASIVAGTPRTSNANKLVTKRIGYIGAKRYVTCNMAATVSAVPASVDAILYGPTNAPVAT